MSHILEIIGLGAPKESKEESSGAPGERETAIAQDCLDAITDGDAEAFAAGVRALVRLARED